MSTIKEQKELEFQSYLNTDNFIMAKKIKLELTEAQFNALISVVDTCSSVMEEDIDTQREIKLIDRMLKKNGYKREYN